MKKPVEAKEQKGKSVTAELTAVLEEIVQEEPTEKRKGEVVSVLEEGNLMIGERQYRLVVDHREGFDAERLGERFSDVLSRYDYIVGDWGYDQLRLKGFFYPDNRKAFPDQRIDTLEDYLYEYCNFGCAYFVIERIGGKRERKQTRRRRSSRKPSTQNSGAHVQEKTAPVAPVKKTKPTIKNRKNNQPNNGQNENKKPNAANAEAVKSGGFVIRKREE